jgi:ribonuclease P protein component
VIALKNQASGDLIQVYAKPNGLAYGRIGLIVSKKIERHAVKRNWIKRILRETFRNRRSRYGDVHNMDWVIRLKRSIGKDESLRLVSEVQSLMIGLQQCHDY